MSRVALVTGGNRGIGYAMVKQLCREFDGVVLFTARDENAGKAVCDQLCKELATTNIQFHQLDITSKDSINKLQTHLQEKFGGLDVLINNSGVLFKKSALPYLERVEVSIKTNFFGTLDICNSLFPLLRPHARVVNMSSELGSLKRVSPSLQKEFSSASLSKEHIVSLMEGYVRSCKENKESVNGWPADTIFTPAYCVSKIGVTALTMVQARELKNDSREGILVNAVCPGWVRTAMGGPSAHKSPEEGADTPVYCALLPKGTSTPNGELVSDRAIVPWTAGK